MQSHVQMQEGPITLDDARAVLRRHWGHPDFRPGQWEIISHVLAGRDVCAILPTGGGKSVCYQVPALLLDGLTIVISPLIALMQDQVDGLKTHRIEASFINSSLSRREIDQRWTDAEFGRYKLLYVAPERLQSETFLARAARLKVALLAVDEAHCISEWGHNFRPSYLEIAEGRSRLGDPPTIAVTATATPHVRKDILEHLKLRRPEVIVRGFDRPNIVWSVFRTENKRRKVLDVLSSVSGAGILYSATRKGVESWAAWLQREGESVAGYHGGMASADREASQEAWLRGDKRVMVATNAFGMGIDKPDVRFVIHVDLPGTLEGYYQEAGRGGRDGKTSFAVLVFHPNDEQTPRALIADGHPRPSEVRMVYDTICSMGHVALGGMAHAPLVFQPEVVSRVTGMSPAKVITAVELAARAGAWTILPVRQQIGLLRFKQSADGVRAYAEGLANRKLADFVEALLRTVHADAFTDWWELDLTALAKRSDLERDRLMRGLDYLAEHGIMEWLAPNRAMRLQLLEPRSSKLQVDAARVKASREQAERRLADMVRYAQSTVCRRHFILGYFGEQSPEKCGTCDVCLGRHDPVVVTAGEGPLLREILSRISAGIPRESWFRGANIAAYKLDGFLTWLVQEGFLTVKAPLQGEFELTPKARRFLEKQ